MQSASERQHSIRIEQQPLGGAPALVFAADLKIGGNFFNKSSQIVTTKLLEHWQNLLVVPVYF